MGKKSAAAPNQPIAFSNKSGSYWIPKTTENYRKQPNTTENNQILPKTTEYYRKQPNTTEN